MIKYRGIYRVFLQQCKDGTYTTNKDDTYLKCKNNVHIYRFGENKLAIQFNSNEYRNNRLNDFKEMNIKVTPFVIGDQESVYLFDERDLVLIASILKPIIKGKDKSPKRRSVNLSEERKEQLRQQGKKLIRYKKST